ncbi:hypothetical protein EVAR_84227_1 [Eumeta japonica]|uniref:Uncharacterized protein n=1 Tax=Eumeta variegata TaxID=151549 RepID=A0A4C1WUM4_EUMVA|nr:hypothetical protein EVAR_84227_1 [Eumeta japonica]
MDTQHLPLLITLGSIAHMTPARPPTHRTNWSAYKHTLEELHIGKSFSCPEDVDLAAQHLTDKIQTATRCPRIKRDLNYTAQELQQALWTFRGTAWKKTIEQAGDDWKSLYLLCRRLTRATTPVFRLFSRMGTGRYTTKDRTEILAEFLEEQFTPHPSLNSREAASHHARVERRVQDFLTAPVTATGGLLRVPGGDCQSDHPTAYTEGSGTRRNLDRSHKTAA